NFYTYKNTFYYPLTTEVTVSNDEDSLVKTPWFLMPYNSINAEKFITICRNENLKPAFYSNNKLNKFIKVQKDALPTISNKNMVYKIECKDCDATSTKYTLKGHDTISRNATYVITCSCKM
ncbi:hypothetical protein ALC60_07061, partial [Trachymyrmex zeteki]